MFFTRLKNHLLNFLQTQLIVTIAAVPIIVGWGLSLSVMTFVGNLLFSPVLTIFLILSSLVFFTQLLNIPNDWLIVLLEQFTQYWDWVLAHGSSRWLIEFCKPPTLFLFAIPIVTFFVLYFGKFKTACARMYVLGGVLAVSMLGLWGLSYKTSCFVEGSCATHSAPINIYLDQKGNQLASSVPHGLDIHQNTDGKLTIVDDGFYSRRPSPEKAVEFELKPYLVKKFGKVCIAELIIKRPGQRNFKTALALCALFSVSRVTIYPFLEKKLTKGGLRAFFELKKLGVLN